ncbi:probable serine/threonine-protein kinase DDB_G0271682 [Oryza brachyantha]|nr:probable serine/threonine-protein kinase DDB_G0271682 [Oryza brachyantha]XP_006662840.1 probable serine/threonine-protein kinase DDB_G0271682 [Oryza brachyantha]XP_006662841.1 probable serine/threonine-protein kinase DDB_G0271682 [Oryza brachyantha]XP_015698096.1 probable serine/threonine-protein kinase DDB_G0271682 [Oryza brachyantha]XP_015698097.1 probable serine/threonine-protein kinase DDB_G0271682 [Oryza brachyantha]
MTGSISQYHDKFKFKVDIKQNIKVFTEDEIKRITSNFSVPIGRGGFGEVYRGTLDDDYDLVAVKRYISKDLRKEFMEEVSIHSQMSHKNVVELIGYCIGESTLMIVTKYISKGNLDDILHNSDISIPLDVRLGIAIGCAEALSHMHSMHLSSDSLVCHGDIKPANILLDDNLTAKLSDFGVSRLLSGGVTQYTEHIKGSTSYMDPIYFQEGCLTPRSDVYSFGIVLVELIARKRVRKGDVNLIGSFNKACASGKDREIFDSAIANKKNMKILKEMRKLAIECLSLDIHKRPQMNVVEKRLRILKKELKNIHEKYSESILASHQAWHKNYNQGITMPSYNSRTQLKKSLSIFKRNLSSSKILLELGNVRIFTQEELNEVTQNYSYLLSGGTSGKVYQGTLEDNTVVAVRRFSEVFEGFEEAFINGGMILSQIVHRNIVRLLGYCLDADCPAFVYEHAARGTLSDVLDRHEDFPLHLRVKIAVQTAEALEYLHSSPTGIIKHGYVVPSKILVDDNFTPKLTGFSWAQRLIKASKVTIDDDVICNGFNNGAFHDRCVSLKLKTDVYQFGVLLLTLISRKNFVFYADHDHLILQLRAAYKTDNSGRAFFDDDIAARSEDITLLEVIGRLSLNCVSEIDQRPTMKEVAEHLRIIRRSWKNNGRADGATLVSEAVTKSRITGAEGTT